MPRGGYRENAGRKSGWNYPDTQTIRVPKIYAAQLLKIARRLDSGESIEFVSKSKTESDTKSKTGSKVTKDSVSKSNEDSVTESNGLSQRQLAIKRLKCDVRQLSDRRDNPKELAEYTRGKDPDGISWEYREGRYYPQ